MYSDGSGHSPEWWQWTLLGVGAALVVASAVVLTVATCGVGTAAFAATATGAIAFDASIGCLTCAAIGTAAGLAGGVIYSEVTGANLGESLLKGFMMGFGIGAIAGALIGGVYGALTFSPNPAIGEVTKLGKVAANQGGKITDYGIHGAERMAERGISKTMVKLTVKFGTSILQNGGKVAYVTQKAFVVLNAAGKIVTTYGSGNFDSEMQDIIRKIFGG